MREINRHIHFDFHTMPGIDNFEEEWDAAVFAQRMQDAHVDYVNVFAMCNLGFAYYDTKIGKKYPGMKGDRLADTLRECHARNIGVTAYINAGLMHDAAIGHADWLRVDAEGRIFRGDRTCSNFFRSMCYNAPGYRERLLGLIREICSYDIDGLFCDCMTFFPCHCDYCTRDMVARGIDITDEAAVLEFDKEVLWNICQEIKQIVGPDRRLYLNGMPQYDYRNVNTHIEVECLPGKSGYDYFGYSTGYSRMINSDVLYMTGRFQATWGDFGGYKGRASLEYDVHDALLYGLKPSVGDHIHPAENCNEDMYKEIGEVYGFVEQMEPYLKGKSCVSDIALMIDQNRFNMIVQLWAGAVRILGELHHSFDILHTDMDFSSYKLLIMPDCIRVDDALRARLEAYLAKGGKILMSGSSGLTPEGDRFALQDEPAAFERIDSCNAGYFDFITRPADSIRMPFAMYEEGVLLASAANEADVRAAYIEPYFNKHYDGLHSYFYAPPKGPNGRPAAVCNGRIGRICFNIFSAYNKRAFLEHRKLVAQLINELMPDPILTSDLPSTSRMTLRGDAESAVLQIKTTYPEHRGQFSVVEEHVRQPAGAFVRIKGVYEKATVLSGDACTCIQENGYTTVTLPEINGYYAVLLEA